MDVRKGKLLGKRPPFVAVRDARIQGVSAYVLGAFGEGPQEPCWRQALGRPLLCGPWQALRDVRWRHRWPGGREEMGQGPSVGALGSNA